MSNTSVSSNPSRAGTRPVVTLIAAVDRKLGIGRDNGLLVRLPEDMRHFKKTTMGAPIVMGRKTWDSIGRPLPGRQNIVVSRDAGWHADGAAHAASFEVALQLASPAGRLHVIGGAEIYALAMPFAHELVLTEIDVAFDADTFFPAFSRADFRETGRVAHRSDLGLDFAFVTYQKI